ncbi:MAG: cytochrome-c peroxidase [Flavobacteriales bacterium]|jgi:cytochrome c peroxidase|nr:cytochrome-c peroxidase [Flavobacteriales bacterium]MBT6174539.1 cytochrome-c peroxidase [Flavobacteriales bacterium]
MKNVNILFVLATSFFVTSCCKHPEVETATPLLLDVPAHVATSIIGEMPIPVDNPTTVEGVALGRKLFYENMLSTDNTMSCATCHVQEDGFSDKNRFSEGITGDLGGRQAMAVINLGWSEFFFWDGRAVSLEDQAFGPVVNPIELNETWPNVVTKLQDDCDYPHLFEAAFGTSIIDSVLVSKAIAQFERTLLSFNSRYDKYFYENEDVFTQAELNGFDVFMGVGECVHCHSGPLLSDDMFRNNGLDIAFTDLGLGDITGDATDNGKFKVTTLRNIAQTAPYMHDGRFATLKEVVEHYNSGVLAESPNLDSEMEHFKGGLDLTLEQKNDLVSFLHTMSDNTFLENPDFSDPN